MVGGDDGRGRDPDTVTPGLFCTVLITDGHTDARRALDEYTGTTYRLPLATVDTIQLFLAGSPDVVRAGLHPYLEAGARHVLCRIAALDLETQREQLELLSTVERA